MLPFDELRGIQKSDRGPTPLTQIPFSLDLRLLVLAPHPDDFDAIAITMRYFFDNGNDITLAVLTDGASGVEDSFVDPPTDENRIKLRQAEQQASLEFFGFPRSKLSFLHLVDGQDDRTQSIWRQAVQPVFTRTDPDIVLLPYGEDSNASHRRTFAVFREIALSANKPLLALYIRDPKTVQIRVDCYVPFDEQQAQWKSKMLRFHQSQQTRNLNVRGYGLDRRILKVNEQIAADFEGVRYAEGFQIELFFSKSTGQA